MTRTLVLRDTRRVISALLIAGMAAATLVAPLARLEAAADPVDDILASIDGMQEVGHVRVVDAEHPTKTVVYIPQIHRSPGTAIGDSVNDSALRAQREIYAIEKKLISDGLSPVVMTEGELFGPVDEAHTSDVLAYMAAGQSFRSVADRLSDTIAEKGSLAPTIEQAVLADLTTLSESAERASYLAGAAHRLKAENEAFMLYGAENQETLEKSANIVRKFVYINDRLGSTDYRGGRNFLSERLTLPPQIIQALRARAAVGKSGGDAGVHIADLEDRARGAGRSDVVTITREAATALGELQALNAPKPTKVTSAGPKRADNPYADISDATELRNIQAEIEKEMQATVVEQRNSETAENMLTALEAAGAEIGVIQFGGAHEEGLVDELVKRDMSVIVVVPRESLKRSPEKATFPSTRDTGMSARPTRVPASVEPPTTVGLPMAAHADRDVLLRTLIEKMLRERVSSAQMSGDVTLRQALLKAYLEQQSGRVIR